MLAKELDVLRCELQQEALRAGRIHINFKTESGRLTLVAQRIIRAVLRVCPADSKVMPLVEAVLSELPGLTFENIPSNNSARAQKQVNLGMSLSFVQQMARIMAPASTQPLPSTAPTKKERLETILRLAL